MGHATLRVPTEAMKYSILTALLVLGTAFATAEDKPAAAKEIMLFNGKSLDDWESVDVGGSGQVELEGGLMIINQGENVSGAIYKKAAALPTTNYEITLEAKRMQGVDFFVGLTFPVGDLKHCASLICGGWGGSSVACVNPCWSSQSGTSATRSHAGTLHKPPQMPEGGRRANQISSPHHTSTNTVSRVGMALAGRGVGSSLTRCSV